MTDITITLTGDEALFILDSVGGGIDSTFHREVVGFRKRAHDNDLYRENLEDAILAKFRVAYYDAGRQTA